MARRNDNPQARLARDLAELKLLEGSSPKSVGNFARFFQLEIYIYLARH